MNPKDSLKGEWRVVGIDERGELHDLEPRKRYEDPEVALASAKQLRGDGTQLPSRTLILKDGSEEDVRIREIALQLKPTDEQEPMLWKPADLELFLREEPRDLLGEFLASRRMR